MTVTALRPVPAPASPAAAGVEQHPSPATPASVLGALGAPVRQGPPAARVPVALLLSLAGRCACDECVAEYVGGARQGRLRAV